MQILMVRSSFAPAAQPSAAPTVTIPTRLIAEQDGNPLAIGLYCLIVRLYLVYHAAAPISANDLAGYDPGASAPAVKRALRRLREGGWIIAARAGNKNAYRPAWGLVAGLPRPWQHGCKRLNRPGHIETAPLDTRLIDICLGRIVPSALVAPEITRYVTAPLLSLRDVGAYLQARRGRGSGTPALERLGLVVGGLTRELGDINELLAAVSQRHLADPSAPALTERGLRRLGIELVEPEPPPPAPALPSGQFLVFMSIEQYRRLAPQRVKKCPWLDGGRDGGWDGLEGPKMAAETGVLAAPEADNSISPSDARDCPWNLGNLNHDSSMENGPEEASAYVKYSEPKKPKRQRKPNPEQPPATPTARRLLELDISMRAARELQHEPLDRIDIMLEYARSRKNIANLGGWLVASLRDARDHGWRPGRYVVRDQGYQLLDLEKYISGKFADVFQRDQGHGPPTGQETALGSAERPAEAPDGAERPWYRPENVPALEDDLLFMLTNDFPEEDKALVWRLRLIRLDGCLALSCKDAADRREFEARLSERLAWACDELHWGEVPRIVVGDGRGGPQPAPDESWRI